MSSRSIVLRPTLGSLRAAAAVLVAVTALAACGAGGSEVKTDAGGLTSVTILRSTGSTFEPLFIAQDQNFFKEAGLNVTIKEGAADTSQNAPSVANGEAQFAMTDSSGFLKAAAQKLPVRIVTQLQASTTKTAPSDGLLVKADSPIKTFADVGGKTIGLPALGGTLQFICEYSAKEAGADPGTIKFVALPVTSLIDAVGTGKVDAAYTFATFYDAGKAAGMRAIGEGTNALPGLPQALIFSSTEFLAKNPAVAEKFIGAVAKGIDYANSHPDAVRAVDTKYTKLPADYIAKRTIQIYSKEINTKTLSTVITSMVAFGLIKSAPAQDSLYWDKAPTTTTSS
ncbi:ABC transporter substrate-binding protein [Nonomuraea sp. NEAU-A123]|uniref:ABC transporter substrate-binding protein n=1 Tax=Nonomuraea sp. NEAU-A123 TaxID=2839649 RepID=UPI001BE3DE7E|nr:ABC transporter substrate-binding protein [Nonomuraea sp. NEAU-A123]MBT2225746.1 ABC transporter substrate-binding protein [Nonomuraea sp. NEAU-A123]